MKKRVLKNLILRFSLVRFPFDFAQGTNSVCRWLSEVKATMPKYFVFKSVKPKTITPISFLLVLLLSCQSAEEIKRNQYFVEGLELYKTHCANCHQIDGTGLEGLYPPISSAFLDKNKMKVICLIQNGINDSLVINGKKYTQPMPANKTLEKLEIAEISTFVYNKWGNETVITDIEDVKKALENCKK